MPPARVLAVALALVTLAACSVGVEHGLDERQANEISAALERAGIVSDKIPDDGQGRWRVMVGRGDLARAFAVLEARALPRRDAKSAGDSFASSGLLSSASVERARLAASIAADLERTLAGLPGVTSARVHLALPVDDPLRGDGAHARATGSVLLRASGTPTFSPSEVQRLVAGAVDGLQPADVTLVIAPAAAEPEGSQLVSLGPVRLAAESRATALGIVTAALLLLLALAATVMVGVGRMTSLRRRVRDLERARSS